MISPVEAGTLRYNLPAAIAAAGAALGPGDVLLIEQQTVGPHGGQLFVPGMLTLPDRSCPIVGLGCRIWPLQCTRS